MASIILSENKIEKTREEVRNISNRIERSGKGLDELVQAGIRIGNTVPDIESARVVAVFEQQKIIENNIADLIIGLEDTTNVFGSEFDTMKRYTNYEKFIGLFSKQKMQQMRFYRVRNTSLADNLLDLLSQSDSMVDILKEQKEVHERCYEVSGTNLNAVIEHRKKIIAIMEDIQNRINELNPLLLDIENKILMVTELKKRTGLEEERANIMLDYDQALVREQELLAESQTLEHHTLILETFVDFLNNQIATQNTLINKLMIDTEQRIVLYKAVEDFLKTVAQEDMVYNINTISYSAHIADEETMAGIGITRQKHIGDLLEMYENNMLAGDDIQRRKKLADEAFSRRSRR